MKFPFANQINNKCILKIIYFKIVIFIDSFLCEIDLVFDFNKDFFKTLKFDKYISC